MTAQLTVLKRRPQLFVQWVAIWMAWVELTLVANVQRCSPPERAVSQPLPPEEILFHHLNVRTSLMSTPFPYT
jgi:hypothetical protein